MIRDPFYRDIIDGLNKRLDPEAFEQCATDVLRDVFPGLVPIRGGRDAGMDGAIADQRGPAFFLVATTSTEGLKNLTANLQSYLADGGKLRRVVFATSRQLTPIKRRNLEKYADKLGFELTQIFDQAAIADRLYHLPEWCKELLNLSGEAPPISAVPLTRRPLPAGELIGRSQEIAWLQKKKDDCIIVGPPGSGKTALAHTLVAKGGLFLISDDIAAIAPAVRQLQPRWIIVDDAHEMPARLDSLRQVRRQIRADFVIVATCWAASKYIVREALATAPGNVLCLADLDRDNLVKVVLQAGVRGPTGLVREIVDQAVGRPGLAMTLATLCLQGETREVLLGDAIVRQTRAKLEQLVGPQATRALAGLALGGKSGMRQIDVAEALNIGVADFHNIITGIAAGGVIEEAPDGALIVRPDALRHALVRDMFFDATPLQLDPLLAKAVDVDAVAETLACARGVGAKVPEQLLIEAFGRCRFASTWGWYASLGENEARWVLTHRPGLTEDRHVAHALLQQIPGEVLPLLMAQITTDDVFLSHSAKDKAVVRAVAERLKADGLRVWLDDWEIRPGDSIPAKIEEGLEHSRGRRTHTEQTYG